jgi:hypothetical protein
MGALMDDEDACLCRVITGVTREDEEAGWKLALKAARSMAKRAPARDSGNRASGAAAPERTESCSQEQEPSQSEDGEPPRTRVDEMIEARQLALEAKRAKLRARNGQS